MVKYTIKHLLFEFGSCSLDRVSGLTFAYSLRKLNSRYKGSLIRIRRSSDNAQLDIGSVGNNLDIGKALSFANGDSAFISILYDQSLNNYLALNVSTSLQPRIINNGFIDTLNGKPAMYFNSNILNATIPLNFNTSTFIIVGNLGSVANSYEMLFHLTNPSTRFIRRNITNNKVEYRASASVTAGTANATGTKIWSMVHDGTNVGAFVNGISDLSTTQTDTPGKNSYNLQIGGSSNNLQEAYIYEFIGLNRGTPDYERLSIEREQGNYYGITIA